MKYIVIGLGNYGSALATKLTTLGHEVIGVDSHMNHIEPIKDKVTHAICLNCTELHALRTLPLQEADVIFVAIGEDFGASIMISALLKQMNVKKIISRAINTVHQTILGAIGIEDIIFPEQDSANRLVKKLEMNNIVDSLEITEDYSIIEAVIPARYIGFSVKDANIRSKYNINVLTIKRINNDTNILGINQKKTIVMGVVSPDEVFLQDDIVVLFGKLADLKKLLYLNH